jgi:hypothetical protein
MTADHPTRSPDSPTVGCYRCGRTNVPLLVDPHGVVYCAAIIDCEKAERRLSPRSSDSVRTPDLDVERLIAALYKECDDLRDLYARANMEEPEHVAARIGGIKYAIGKIKDHAGAALHPASPPQEGEK